MATTPDALREEVRRKYAEAAIAVTEGSGWRLRKRRLLPRARTSSEDFGTSLYGRSRTATSCPMQPPWPRSAAATRPRSPT